MPMIHLQATDSSLFFSRQDPSDPRLGEFAARASQVPGVAILGYADDEGIKLNGGRLGAAQAPPEIRRWLYRMTPHPRRELRALHDLGDVTARGDLGARHEFARETVSTQLKQGHRVLGLGGGNDYSYADGMGFLDSVKDRRPLIINVDAHLDVRESSRGLSSGTPFRRLLESGAEFDFLELGIQTQCNAKAHWDYVLEKGGRILSLEEIHAAPSLTQVAVASLGGWLLKPRPTYLSIDIDAFAWPYAQGSSAAWPVGLDPQTFLPLLSLLLARLDVRVLGIYEVSPPLDQGGGTARLAAQLAHGFLHV